MSFPNAPFQSIIAEAGGKLSSVWAQWFTKAQDILNSLTLAGSTSQRPTQQLWVGQRYWDNTLNTLVCWNGSAWVELAQHPAYWMAAYDNTNQSAANTTTAYPITYNTPNGHNGIDVSGSHITFNYPGVYNIQFSIQFQNTNNNANDPAAVNVWFRVNGNDVAESNSQFTVPTRHGSHNGKLIAALNFIVEITNANDYVQMMWQTENTSITIQTLPAGTTPTTPVTPSVIITAQQI